MKNILKYILTCILLSVCITVASQSYTFRGLSITEGLSELIVNVIYKDSLGFVWLGTENSLERFDGIHIKHYPIIDAGGKSKRVNAIVEMPGNDVWMGNNMGLWRLNKDKDTFEPVAREMLIAPAYSLLHDGKGTLYIGSGEGLYIYKDGGFQQILLDTNLLSEANVITGLTQGKDGTMWMATKKGLYSLRSVNGKEVISRYLLEGEHSCAFHNIVYMDSMIYLGTMGQGIISFDIRTEKSENFVDVGCNVISSLSGDEGKKLLYVGTDGNGVHFISTEDKKIVRSIRHEVGNEESIRSNSVYSVLVDREGVIWVGFFQLGLDYTLYQNGLFATYAYPPFFTSRDMSVRTIAIHGSEKLIGSRDGLFYINERKGIYKSFNVPQLRSNMIFCTLYYQGEYYVGTYGGGMYILNPVTLTIRDFEPGESFPFVKGHIFCIKQDGEDNLWIGTSAGVYCYKDGKQIAHFTKANSKLPDDNVYTIFFDSTHKGWMGTENGLCIWDSSSKTLRTDIFPEEFIHKAKIRNIYEDSDHNLYFSPDKGPLFISDLSMKKLRHLPPTNPLEGKDCMFVIEDNDKWIWIGTSNGLFRHDKKGTFIPYAFVDGIPSPIFINCPPVKENDRLWFGNSKGLLYWDMTRKSKVKKLPYPVRITDILVNGKSIESSAVHQNSGVFEVKLDASQKNVTFCLSDFSYTSPTFISYEYKLEGIDEDWKTLTGQSEITYYNLHSGKFNFKVRRMNDYESEITMQVRVASSVGVWSIAGLVVIILLGGFVYYRQRNKKRGIVQELPVIDIPEERKQHNDKPVYEEKYKTNKLSDEECSVLKEKLEKLMSKEKLYKNPDLKIGDLAELMGMSLHSLSYLFNYYMNCKYNDYINNCRVEEFKLLVGQDEYARYTLEALSELCGFSSKTSFFRNFKRVEGITPNEYVRSIGKTNE